MRMRMEYELGVSFLGAFIQVGFVADSLLPNYVMMFERAKNTVGKNSKCVSFMQRKSQFIFMKNFGEKRL